MNWPAICTHCGERIGVYEPAVVIEPQGQRQISLITDPEVLERPAPLLHTSCATDPAEADAEAALPS